MMDIPFLGWLFKREREEKTGVTEILEVCNKRKHQSMIVISIQLKKDKIAGLVAPPHDPMKFRSHSRMGVT
jgi:hypothetical protein